MHAGEKLSAAIVILGSRILIVFGCACAQDEVLNDRQVNFDKLTWVSRRLLLARR